MPFNVLTMWWKCIFITSEKKKLEKQFRFSNTYNRLVDSVGTQQLAASMSWVIYMTAGDIMYSVQTSDTQVTLFGIWFICGVIALHWIAHSLHCVLARVQLTCNLLHSCCYYSHWLSRDNLTNNAITTATADANRWNWCRNSETVRTRISKENLRISAVQQLFLLGHLQC